MIASPIIAPLYMPSSNKPLPQPSTSQKANPLRRAFTSPFSPLPIQKAPPNAERNRITLAPAGTAFNSILSLWINHAKTATIASAIPTDIAAPNNMCTSNTDTNLCFIFIPVIPFHYILLHSINDRTIPQKFKKHPVAGLTAIDNRVYLLYSIIQTSAGSFYQAMPALVRHFHQPPCNRISPSVPFRRDERSHCHVLREGIPAHWIWADRCALPRL